MYSANVMLFRQPASAPLPSGCKLILRPPEGDLAKFQGLLVLRTDLTATSELPEGTETPKPDASAPHIALPVPTEAKRNGRWAVLPGAPKAFLTEDVDGYSDTSTLARWCKDKGDFQPSVIDEVRTYFSDGDGAQIRSFVSRPLIDVAKNKVGVLNIQSNRIGILGDMDERLPVFQAMLTPILLELTEVLVELERLEKTAQHA